MLRKSLEWRQQHRVDTLLKEFKGCEVMEKFFATGIIGRDKFGHQLWLARYGQTDMTGILKSVTKAEYLRYVIYWLELGVKVGNEILDQLPPPRSSSNSMAQFTTIFDMDGISMRHVTNKQAMDVAIEYLNILQSSYPESLRRYFVVNAPPIFNVIFSILKPFISEKTGSKIRIFGHDSNEWKSALLEEIDADQLPVTYGGTVTDPDGNPNCQTKVNMGGPVPHSYFFKNRPKYDKTDKQKLFLARGEKERLEYFVEETGSNLSWEFYCDEGDVAYAIYYKQQDETHIPIVPHDRVECHLSAEEGQITCNNPGIYIFEFDNSFSYLRGKTLWYSINVSNEMEKS